MSEVTALKVEKTMIRRPVFPAYYPCITTGQVTAIAKDTTGGYLSFLAPKFFSDNPLIVSITDSGEVKLGFLQDNRQDQWCG